MLPDGAVSANAEGFLAKPLPRRPSATRVRIMGARYPYYLLTDSREGRIKEAKLSRKSPSEAPTYNNIRQGFVYERVPHITLKSIANNAESALSRLANCAMQGGGELPWEVTCRGVVDGIAMVIHMNAARGTAVRGRSAARPGLRRATEPLAHRADREGTR